MSGVRHASGDLLFCVLVDVMVFETYEECINPTDELLVSKIEAPPIDPSTYLAPIASKNNCASTRNIRTTDGSCPHMQSGLRLWEDPNTWMGSPPVVGEWVNVPAGVKVLVTACSVKEWETYAGIIVPTTSEVGSQYR